MIQLTNKTTIALLLLVMKQNYGKSWWTPSEREGFIAVGIHSPEGEIGYYIPEEYKFNMSGMIELTKQDLLDTAFENEASDRLLRWSSQV